MSFSSRSIFQVTDVIDHPNWAPDIESNDLSYDFRLFRVSVFSDEQPIDLDNGNNKYIKTNEPLTIMGWG